MIPVILSGGSGSRLWPLSRGMYPKQLLPLADSELTLLQQSLLRAMTIPEVGVPVVICNEEHRFMVAEQLKQLNANADILLEPEGRNTAPAIALAALQALRAKPEGDELLLVMPADHVVQEPAEFCRAVTSAISLAQDGELVTFGVQPHYAETGYGYIQSGEALESGFRVASFKEKPDSKVAQGYIEEGGYFWNAGIFLFSARAILAELQRYQPDIFLAVEQALNKATLDLDFIRVDKGAFSKSPNISIDCAVMEKTVNAAVVPLNCGWSDVGCWQALWDVLEKDAEGNATQGNVLLKDTADSLVYSDSKLIAVSGMDSVAAIQTADAVLVTPLSESQNVKRLVEELISAQSSVTNHHRKVYRPWGWYDSVDSGDRFQVKRIQVKPGAKLSLQKHKYRAEHWVVVSGVAEVVNGDHLLTLNENESTYISAGTVHSLRNPSADTPLEIIEVQSGSYLGEDDIVRFDDEYGRA